MRQPLLSTLLLAAGLAAPATAQVRVQLDPLGPLRLRLGVRAGAQVTRLTTTAPDYVPAELKYNYWGGQAGLVLEAALGWLSLQQGVVFSQKGYREKRSWTQELQGTSYPSKSLVRLRLNYLELPLNLVATVHGVQLFAGPYLGVGLGGEYKYTYTKPMRTSEYYQTYALTSYANEAKIGFGQKSPTPYYRPFRRLDAGYQAGVGYRRNGWQAQAAYSHGVKNSYESPYIGYNPPAENRGFQLTLTRFFGRPEPAQ